VELVTFECQMAAKQLNSSGSIYSLLAIRSQMEEIAEMKQFARIQCVPLHSYYVLRLFSFHQKLAHIRCLNEISCYSVYDTGMFSLHAFIKSHSHHNSFIFLHTLFIFSVFNNIMLTAEITQFMFRQGEYILENYSIT
jgi:hypothetical protein